MSITINYIDQLETIELDIKRIKNEIKKFINNPQTVNDIKILTNENKQIYNNVLNSSLDDLTNIENKLKKIDYYLSITPSFVNSKMIQTQELISSNYELLEQTREFINGSKITGDINRFQIFNKKPTNITSIIVVILLIIISLYCYMVYFYIKYIKN